MHGKAQRIEHLRAKPAVADRERADRVAVVRVLQRDEAGLAARAKVVPVLERDLQRLLDGRRAVGCVQKVRCVDRHHTGERFGQLDDDAVAVAEHRRVRALGELRAHGVVELGDAVAERRDPQRRDRVEITAAVDVDDVVAFGMIDDHRPVALVGRHLREAVPHHPRIPLGPAVGVHHGDFVAEWSA